MNGWLRIEGEQRGAWLSRRVQDVRAADVARRLEPAAPAVPAPVAAQELAPTVPPRRLAPKAVSRPAVPQDACVEVA